jgi:hypothetical protein
MGRLLVIAPNPPGRGRLFCVTWHTCTHGSGDFHERSQWLLAYLAVAIG